MHPTSNSSNPQSAAILPFPIRSNHTENSRYALARLCRGEQFLCGEALYGQYFPALASLADAVRISRGRP